MVRLKIGDKRFHPNTRILAFILEQKFAIASQISLFCLKEGCIRYTRKILKRLSDEGLIAAKAVFLTGSYTVKGYHLTELGRKELSSTTGIDIDHFQIKSNYKEHDVTLTDIRLKFARCIEANNFLSENILQSRIFSSCHPSTSIFSYQRSDAAVELVLNNKSIWVGIEFERSNKTDTRVKEKFKNWYQTDDLKGILLIAQTDTLKHHLEKIEKKIYPDLPRKIYFSTISNFIDERRVVFTGNSGKAFNLNFVQEMNRFSPVLEQKLSAS